MISLNDNKELGYEICRDLIYKTIGNNLVVFHNGFYTLRTLNTKNSQPVDVVDNCQLIEEFNGVIRYLKNNKYGLIDMDGNIITDPIFDELIDYIDGVAIVKEHKKIKPGIRVLTDDSTFYRSFMTINLIDISGKFLTHDEYDDLEYIGHGFFKTTSNFKKGLINSKGVKILDPIYANVIAVNENFVLVIGDRHPLKWQVIDVRNVELSQQIKFKYSLIQFIKDDRWLVYKRFTGWKIVDNNNNEIKRLNRFYDGIGDFINGYAPVNVKKKYGLIDEEGNEVIDPIYKVIEPLGSHLWKLGFGTKEQLNSMYGLIDMNGNEMKNFNYQFVKRVNPNFMLVTKPPQKNIYYKIYNTNNHSISDSKYRYCETVGKDLIKVDEGVGPYLINENQDVLSNIYFDISDFECGIAEVRSAICATTKLINENGKELNISYSPTKSLVTIQNNLILRADVDLENNILYTLYNIEGNILLEFRAISCHILNDNQIIIDNYLYNLEDLLNLENQKLKRL